MLKTYINSLCCYSVLYYTKRDTIFLCEEFMRHGLFVIALLTAFSLLDTNKAYAQNEPLAAIDSAATRIELDETTGEIRFFIKGVMAAVLRDDGLHLRNNLQFGGITKHVDEKDFARPVDDSTGIAP